MHHVFLVYGLGYFDGFLVSFHASFGGCLVVFHSNSDDFLVECHASFGGFLFMALCAGFIGTVIVLEASPVYSLFMAGIRNRSLTLFEWFWIAGSFISVFIICILALLLPMKFGEKRLLNHTI